MMILHAIRDALLSIRTKKVRSFLTMLGIIIGVAQIIALIGLGQGIKQDVTKEITELGSNILIVLPGKVETSGGGFNPAASVGTSTLTDEDLAMIKKMPDIVDATPISLMAATPSFSGKEAPGSMILAVEKAYFDYANTYRLLAGRYFTVAENATAAPVVVVGKDVVTQLFPGTDPAKAVDQTIKLGKNQYTIVGVIDVAQSASMFTGGSGSIGIAFVPFQTAKAANANTQIFRIAIKARDAADVKTVKRDIHDALTAAHGADDTTVFTQDDLLKVIDNILSLITKAIVALASISLVVGGIGIMNIMLVAVSERTREIGLRKAVGASNWSILFQFLTESALIALLGGGIGTGLVAIAGAIAKSQAGITIVVDFQSVMLAVAFSLGVGIIFGLAPAIRASRKDPIEALRYE